MSAGLVALAGQMAEMSGKAAVQTLAVVGDDLAISANQLIGGQPERKLPMVARVVKGSLRNKAIIVPAALILSFTFPAGIVAALGIGGALLSFDSVDKLLHKKLAAPKGPVSEAYANDHAAWEDRHVKRALKTDLVLSAETTVVSLWAVAAAPFVVQAAAVAVAGLAMTAAVYSVVAGIIKMDDVGGMLAKVKGDNIFARAARGIGKIAEHAAPKIIKVVGALGTAAMFVVGGSMLLHGIPGGEHMLTSSLTVLGTNPLVQASASLVAHAVVGTVAGIAALPVMKVIAPPLSKLRDFAKKIYAKVTKQPLLRQAENDNDEPSPLAESKQDVFKSAPDVKAALNAAAPPAKPPEAQAPAELKAQPAAKKPEI